MEDLRSVLNDLGGGGGGTDTVVRSPPSIANQFGASFGAGGGDSVSVSTNDFAAYGGYMDDPEQQFDELNGFVNRGK